jgi:RHS repeat-associated protein
MERRSDVFRDPERSMKALLRITNMKRRCALLLLYVLTLDSLRPLMAQPPDTEPPTVRILENGVEMADGARFNRAVQPAVEVTDASSVTVDSQLNGAAFTPGSTVAAEGQHELAVAATDAANNSANHSVHFEIDTTPPQLVSVLPQDGSLTSAAEVTLEGDATGAAALTVDGQAVDLVGGHFVAGPYSLSEGLRTWSLVASDLAGNQATKAHRIVRDATAPVLTLGQPAQAAVLGSSPIQVTGTASDTHLLTVTVNGTPATLAGTAWTALNVPLAEGANVLSVDALDAAGNLTTVNRAVELDTLAPSVSISDPAAGTVVPGASITVAGAVSDPHLDRVEVNGVLATISGGSWSASVPLVEGSNTVVARAFDKLGWNTADSVSVQRDSQAPPIHIDQPNEGAWLAATSVTVSGTIEEETGLTATVNGVPAVISGGQFTAQAIALTEGENRLIARVVDRLGNQGAHTLLVYRDTISPQFVASAPAAGALAVPLDAVFDVTFSEELRAPLAAGSWRLETAAGLEIPAGIALSGSKVTISPQAALPSRTAIRIVLTTGLVDRAGNALAEAGTLTFTTADREAPAAPVLAAPPAGFVCGPRLAFSGTAEADAVIEVTGGAGVATTRVDAQGAFALTVDLRPETLNRLEIGARDAEGNRSTRLAVEVVHDCTPPRVTGAELESGIVEVAFSERIAAANLAGQVRLLTASGEIAGTVAALPSGTGAAFTPSSALPAEPLRLEVSTGIEDFAANDLAYPYTQVFGTGVTESFIAGRVIDAKTGRPLAGAVVVVVASNGAVTPEPQPEQTTAADGRFRLPVGAGTHTLLVARSGYTPGLRSATVSVGRGVDIFDPRLTPATATGLPLEVPAGVTPVTVTALEEQGLPALLPYGWSPRGAAWIDLGGATLASPATLTLPVEAPDGTDLAVVRLNSGTLQWHVTEILEVADGVVNVAVDREGGWAAVEADTGDTAPPAPAPGAVLGSGPAPAANAVVSASVVFDPQTVLPTQRSVATVAYTLAPEASLASGLPLTLSVREELTLLDGSVRRPGAYETDLVVYRSPSGALRSRFGLQPSAEAASTPLTVGAEDVSIRPYAGETVRGNVLGPQGGSVATDEGDTASIPAGGLAEPTAVTLTRLPQTELPRAVPAGTSFLGLLHLDLSGRALSAAAQLTLELGVASTAGDKGLLYQAVDLGNGALWRPVASLVATATGWTTAAIDPQDLPWPGVRESGSYLFAKLTTPVAYLRGTVYDVGGAPLPGALLSSTSVAWVQLSSGGALNGRYVLPAPVGNVSVLAENRSTGNLALATVVLPEAEARVDLDLFLHVAGPLAVEITPADGATNVLPGIEPTVRFSEPVDPATAAAGILLYDGATLVAVGLDVDGALVRVNPHSTLRPGATHELRVTTAVRDLQGNRLEQAVTSTFVTQQSQISNQLDLTRIHLLEPVNGSAKVVGRPGAVPANSSVIVERTTGSASTVGGAAAPDGSFELLIPATLADTLLLHILRVGQSEILLELTPFLTADGRAAHVDEGAAVTFTTLDDITIAVEAGTFLEPALVRAVPKPIEGIQAPAPVDVPVVAAIELDFGGVEAQKPLQITLPTPAGATHDDFLLSRVYTILGQDYWMLYDLMRRSGGTITTELLPAELAAGLNGLQPVAVVAAQVPQGGDPGDIKQITGAGRGSAKPYLPGAANPGLYLVMENTTFLDFVAFPFGSGANAFYLQSGLDGCIAAINASIERLLAFDAVLMPVRRGQPSTIVGRDLSTGFKIFEQTFDAPAPGQVVRLTPANGDHTPPWPVGGSPLRFLPFVPAAVSGDLDRGIHIDLQGGALTISGDPGSTQDEVQVRLFGLDDAVNATIHSGADGSFALAATVTPGNRYLLAIGAVVAATASLDLELSEGLADAFPGIGVRDATGKDVHPRISAEGTAASVRIVPAHGWRAGAAYTLRLAPALSDAAGNAWNRQLDLEFEVEASEVLDTYDLPAVRDIAMLGSLVFVAADTRGLVVMDASDPADLKNLIPGNVTFPLADPVMGVTVDPHGRVLIVGGGVNGFGQLKIFDPLALDPVAVGANPGDPAVRYAAFAGSTLLSDKLGADPGTSLPEGKPEQVTVLSDDERDSWRIGVDAKPAGVTITPATPPANGAEYTVTVSGDNGTAGLPVTFRDLSRGRWHRVDAAANGHYEIQLSVLPGDDVELLRNANSYAYVVTRGAGIQVVDVNAFYRESPGDPDPASLESDVVGMYSGYEDPTLSLCGQPVSDIASTLIGLGTLFDRDEPSHPLTLVGLVGLRGLALFDSDPADVGDVSFFNELCLDLGGSAQVSGLEVVEDYRFDLDGDGTLEEHEERDYILVAHRTQGVLILNATDRDNVVLVGWIRLGGGQAARVSVDREHRRMYVSGYGGGIYVVDFDRVPTTEIVDLNQDSLDDRLLETITLPGNTNAAVFLLPELGVAYAGGLDRGLTSISVGGPRIKALAANRGAGGSAAWREINRLAPLGVPTAPEAPNRPDLPASFRVLATLPGIAGNEVRLDVVSLGAGGLPIGGAGDPAIFADLPRASMAGPLEGLLLRRQAQNRWEEGYQLYLSDEIAAVSDLRAARGYTRTAAETGQCARCNRGPLGIPDGAREILSGNRIAVRLPAAVRAALSATYDAGSLNAAEIAIESTPWELAPALRQEPTLNSSSGTGDAISGTLLHSGEMSLAATDLAVKGRGFDFAFTRFYRNQALGAGPFGPGWDHVYNQRLRELPNGDVELFDGRGRRDLFSRQANGTLTAPAGRFVTLERNAAGWLLIDPAHNLARFDRFGRLLSISDSVKDSSDTGNEMRFAYDSASRLARITDTLDRKIELVYDGQGRLERLEDFTGREVTYTYDAAGRLISVTSPKVETGESTFPNGLTTRYEYADASGALTQALRARDNLIAVRDPKNQERFRLTYTDADADGRSEEVTAQLWGGATVQISYDFTARRTTVTDRRGNPTLYDHDTAGHPVRIEDSKHAVSTLAYNADGLVTSMTEPLGRVTAYTYDSAAGRRSQGNAKQVSVTADSRGANGSASTLTTTMQYEPRTNQPIQIDDSRGAVTKIMRDSVGLPKSIVRAHGTAIASETRLSYNVYGQPVEATDPNGHKTHYAYSAAGQSRGYLESATVDPGGLGISARYQTDSRGNVVAVTDPRGVRSEQTINELGLVVESRQAVTGAAGAPALGYKTIYLYDANSNLTEQRLPYGESGEATTRQVFTYGSRDELLTAGSEIEPGGVLATTTRSYDENLNLVRLEDPEGRATEVTYDERDQAALITRAAGAAEAITEQLSYDPEGQRISFRDGRNALWQSAYDGFGRVKQTADPLENKTAVTYDNGSLPLGVKRLDAANAVLAESSAVHDLLGRRTHDRQMLFTADQPGSRTIESRVEYDRAGNLLRLIDPLNRVTELTYDPAGRVIEQVDPLGNRTALLLDAAGNATKTTSFETLPGGGTAEVETLANYDALGRQVSVRDGMGNTWRSLYDARGNVRTAIDPQNAVTAYRFDGLNRLIQAAQPEGIEITYGYDKSSRPVTYRDANGNETTYGYDPLGRLKQTSYADGTTKLLTRDPAGHLTQIRDANGTVVTRTFDLAGRMTGRSAQLAPNVAASAPTRTIDVAGQMTGTSVQPAPSVVASAPETYEYDGLGRLTRIVSGSRVTTQTYDSVSNLLKEVTPDGSLSYVYDDIGNPLSTTLPSQVQVAQTFDALNRPVTISRGAQPALATYEYRGSSLLAGKTLGNGISGTWQYDAARRPVVATFASPLGRIYQEMTSWSPKGLKVAQSRGDQNGAGLLFGYDDANRLVQSAHVPAPIAAAPNNTPLDPATLVALPEGVGFTYDAAQNLVSRTVRQAGAAKPESMPLDASGRNRPASANGKPLEWDANGNLVRRGDQRLQYDDRNRLTKVTDLSGTEQASYGYDTFNRRIQKTVGSETRTTVWDGWQSVEEYKNGQLASRRTYGAGLDEIVSLENDLNSDGTLESVYAPLYDSTGNLIALTGANGKPIERYLYDPYGKQTILVDSLPPAVEQVRVKDGALWLEISEEVDATALAAALAGGQLTLTPAAGGDPVSLTAAQPVQEGLQARRRIVLTPASAPTSGTSYELGIGPEALLDSFLNRPTSAFELTFDWPVSDAVVQDTVLPRVEQVLVRAGHLEVELSEEPDLTAAASALQVDGQAVAWTLDEDRYTLKSVSALAPGAYELTISTASLDLGGLGLAELYEKDVAVSAGLLISAVSRRPDPRQVSTSAAGNPFGFKGLPVDQETGLVYVRNRYYDPEMGRFVSVDPLGYVDGPNPYGFAINDPTNGSDPLGLRKPTAEDDAARAALAKRIVDFDWQFAETGAASTELMETGFEYKHWWALEQESYFRWVKRDAKDKAGYQEIRAQLQRDHETFVAAVAEADEDGGIEYSSLSGSFYTFTRAEATKFNRSAALYLSPIWVGDLVAMIGGAKVAARSVSAQLIRQSWEGSVARGPVSGPLEDTSFIGKKVRWGKQRLHLEGSKELDSSRGYMRNMKDAQAVLDAFHSGKATIISVDQLDNAAIVKVEGVIGIHRGKSGAIVEESSVFLIKGVAKGEASVVPINPRLEQQ